MRVRITAIGDNCVDEYVEPVGRRFAGGNAFNVAVQVARLGLPSEYMGAVGDDPDGRALKSVLELEGVEVDRLRVLHGPTAVTRIEIREGGERVFLSEELGVVADYSPSRADLVHAAGSNLVHGAGLAQVREFLEALGRAGARASYDFSTSDAPSDLHVLDVAFFASRPGTAPLDLARFATSSGATAAVVTCGSQGSVAVEGDVVEEVPAARIDPVDTTGAGDAYIAAFLVERLSGAHLRECMLTASTVATKACLHLGGSPRAELHGEV